MQSACLGAWLDTPVVTEIIGTPEFNHLDGLVKTFAGQQNVILRPCITAYSPVSCLLWSNTETQGQNDPWTPACKTLWLGTNEEANEFSDANKRKALKATLSSLWSKTLHFKKIIKRSFICNPVKLTNLSFGHCYKNILKRCLWLASKK